MQHLMKRISERVTDNDTARNILTVTLDKVARTPKTGAYAVLVGRVSFQDVSPTQNSNGNLAVVIVRDGAPVTFMWRRDNQPWTAQALRVDGVIGKVR